MAEQLSGTIVVIIIAVGVQGCIMLFIFAKRQIMRFALRNKRGPHTSIAQGAPKPLRRESDRCLEYIPYIRHEPRVSVSPRNTNGQVPEHFYRASAVEQYNSLEREIASYSLNYSRLPGSNVRAFLLKCMNGPLLGVDTTEIHVICDGYEHARHHFDEFGEEKLKTFSGRIKTLRRRLRENRAQKPHPSPTPNSSGTLNGSGKTTGRRKKNRDSVSVSFSTKGMSRTKLITPPTEVVVLQPSEGAQGNSRHLTAV